MSAESRMDRARQRLHDERAAADGLLDPDQPTPTAHRDWLERTYGPFRPGEFTASERAQIRSEYTERQE